MVFWIDESLNGVEMVTLIPGFDRDSRTCRFNYMINAMFNVCSWNSKSEELLLGSDKGEIKTLIKKK